MCDARETLSHAAHENLAAPNTAIVPVPSAVEAHASDPLLPLASFCQYRGHVGAMMLDGARSPGGKFQSMNGRRILGMTIVHNDKFIPGDFIHRDKVPDGFTKGSKRLIMTKISDMLTDKCLPVDHQCDCILEVGPQRKDRGLPREGRHRTRSVTPSPPKDGRTQGADTNHRVVNTPRDWALPDQERICDFGKAFECVLIFVANRFTGPVRTGHHQRLRGSLCE